LSRLYVEVAVPLPLESTLTYSVPEGLESRAQPGCRARVQVGKRRLMGTILARTSEEPKGFKARDLESIVDLEPVIPEDLLELARFVGDYYMAPPGDVLKALLPSGLSPWGEQSVRLTDGGALALLKDPLQQRIVSLLHEAGSLQLAELHSQLAALGELGEGAPSLTASLAELEGRGLISITRPGGRGSRYTNAVDLAPGSTEEHLERCGRSKQGRAVIEHLVDLRRPATVSEIVSAIGCGKSVVRRLVTLGILHQFTQIERLPLDRHLSQPAKDSKPIVLRPDQVSAVTALTAAVSSPDYAAFLLAGVTGAGKTEVYLRVVQHVLDLGRGAILMVPEISLVPALARAVRARFGDRLAILHSGLSKAERHQEWERIRSGQAQVVLGPRSAIFAPVVDLAFVVVDEEQDSSYKQESSPRYNGRDIALVRARSHGAAALLVSATPSLETRLNTERGRFGILALTERVGQGQLPEGVLVDLKLEGKSRKPGEVVFSERLLEEIELTLTAGLQVILLRNRRGYAPVLLCRACGFDHECEDCGLPRTLHRRPSRLLCHYCGSTLPVPTSCAKCSEAALEPVGTGTERVEEMFRELFPGIAVDVLDRDAVQRLGSTRTILDRFGRGETQVLVGTQMVSKGHHFPQVALTGVLHADSYLSFPDFRAVERTYALLIQLAGRAGRGEVPGKVVIQTFHPEHYAIQAALRHDDHAFAEQEMRFRRVFHYPPFTRMIQILLRGTRRDVVEREIHDLERRIRKEISGSEIRLMGPAPAPFERLQGKWRFQLLLRAASATALRQVLDRALPKKLSSELILDVDPHQLL
jgi:primosomal protein N' (replication factor Y)